MTPLALDIAVSSVIMLSIIVAYMRGIIKEMFTVVGLFMAAFIAYKLGHVLVPEFNNIFKVPESGDSEKAEYVLFGLLSPAVAATASSYGSTFAVVLIVVLLLGRMFSKWVKEAGMEIVDKVLGALFGFARGFMVVFAVYIPFHFLISSKDMPDWAKESNSVVAFEGTFKWLSKEMSLDKKIEERSDGLVIKFDKIAADKLLNKDADENVLVKTLGTVTDGVSEGASGIADTIKNVISSEEETKETATKSKDEEKRQREIEAEKRRAEEKKRYEEQMKASELKDSSAVQENIDEYVTSPEIDSYMKEGAFEEQKATPEDFYNPNGSTEGTDTAN